jgi:phage baseplate assembly protein W
MAPLVPPLRGWPLLPLPDDHGQLDYPVPDDSVRQQIRVILSTRPGEQLLRPDFGAGLDSFLHQPNTPTTWRAIQDRVKEALGRWEPRIVVDSVDAAEIPGRPTELRVQIAYRLRRTGAAARVGLTLELGS